MSSEHAPIGPGNAQVMNRFDLTKRLVAKLPGEEAVIGGIGNTNFDLWAAGPRPQNFYMLGSMGLACPIALGVALAQPHRHVVALEGDGSLLMQLGCLATIAMLKPHNLTVVVMDNGIYQITGSQPTATRHGADIVTMARGAGIAQSFWPRMRRCSRNCSCARLPAGPRSSPRASTVSPGSAPPSATRW
jgi:thiamine pyrophosphate-dependent acetolactate synthase large subunit-like protein